MTTQEYVLGRQCQDCIDTDNHPHGIAYLSEECEHHKKRVLMTFPSRADAMRYIYHELNMTDDEVMIIPREEVVDDEQ